MNNVIIKNDVKIENMIYEIRGKQVMLDSDLAKLYNVETKRINEAVKNNIEKFPERYCFKLTDDESNNLLVEIFDQKILGFIISQFPTKSFWKFFRIIPHRFIYSFCFYLIQFSQI